MLKEVKIHDDLIEIVRQEAERVLGRGERRDEKDMIRLEKAAKVYSLLMASYRENLRTGAFGNIRDDELAALDASPHFESAAEDAEEADDA